MGYPHDKVSTPLNVVVSGFSRIELHKFYIIYVNTSFIIFNTAFKIEKKCGDSYFLLLLFSSVQLLSHVRLFATP